MSFKEKYIQWKKSAKKFWDENKTEIMCVGGFIFGSWLTYKIVKTEEPTYRPVYQPVPIPTPVPAPAPMSDEDSWDEDKMRKNWDWVCELASNMELESGEEYYIGNSDVDGCGVPIGNNMVSHFVDCKEVYPDDADSYELMYENNENDEEEDEEDEEETNSYLIKLSDEADDDVRDIARKFAVLANNGLVEIEMED